MPMLKRKFMNVNTVNECIILVYDTKAPVEVLGMKVIDEMIKAEVSYYKKIYEEGGLEALLDKL